MLIELLIVRVNLIIYCKQPVFFQQYLFDIAAKIRIKKFDLIKSPRNCVTFMQWTLVSNCKLS